MTFRRGPQPKGKKKFRTQGKTINRTTHKKPIFDVCEGDPPGFPLEIWGTFLSTQSKEVKGGLKVLVISDSARPTFIPK